MDRAKASLLGNSPGRLPKSGLRVGAEEVVSAANSGVVSVPLAVLNLIIVVGPGVGDMPASGLPDWRVVSAAPESDTEPGVVRTGGSRGLIVESPRFISDFPSLSVSCGVVAAVVAAVVPEVVAAVVCRGLKENGRSGALLLAPSSPPFLPEEVDAPRPKKIFLSVGLGGETLRCVGSDTTTLGRGVNPAVLLGVNASSS